MKAGKFILLLYSFTLVFLMSVLGCLSVPQTRIALIITLPSLACLLMLAMECLQTKESHE